MDEPTQPYAVPPGAPNEPEGQRPPLPPRPQPPMGPAGMPPLGPPYAAPSVPPPPMFPPSPPEQWPAVPPLVPVEAGPPSYAGGGRPREPGDPRRGALLIAAIGAAAIVIVGVLAWGQSTDDSNSRFIAGAPTTTSPLATDSESSTESSSSESGRSSSSSSSSAEPDLQTAVLDIQRFVERERDLKFKTNVEVQLATTDELTRMLDEELAKEGPAIAESQQVLRALGLIPPTFDLAKAQRDLLDNTVLGFYDPETKKLVVRGTQVTPFVRDTLAHELTHALDDQWFNLDRPQLDTADDESGFGFTGLAEGDATRVEQAYLDSLSSGEQAAVAREQLALTAAHPELFRLPQVLLDILKEPYTDGPLLVNAILDAGGRARLDSAFQQPPTTSEQVIEPDKFLEGEGAVPVAAPAADGAVQNKGALGAFMFEEILLGSSRTSDVNNAVTGWGGDSYVTWVDASGKACLRDTFVGDTPGDTKELADALNEWAPDVDATVTAPAGQPGTFTVCS